jgi:hypothetical protein
MQFIDPKFDLDAIWRMYWLAVRYGAQMANENEKLRAQTRRYTDGPIQRQQIEDDPAG